MYPHTLNQWCHVHEPTELTVIESEVAFHVRFATFPSNLVWIGPLIKNWQQFFKIQDGGGRHLDLSQFWIFDMTVALHVRFATFSPN